MAGEGIRLLDASMQGLEGKLNQNLHKNLQKNLQNSGAFRIMAASLSV